MARFFSLAAVVLQCGVRLIDIGERLGLTQPTVSRQLAGELKPHPDLIAAVCLIARSVVVRDLARLIEIDEEGGS